tara:strand:+ start:3924 stop:4547 length:624 start_codon:yes stop_codon:yes gene_type:complete
LPDFEIEKSLEGTVIGVDEVGRGPLAGPVVSCACTYKNYEIDKKFIDKIDDSKKISYKNRIKIFKIIQNLKDNKEINYSLGFATVEEIDSHNILEATKLSMIRAINKLNFKKGNIIFDGKMKLNIKNFISKDIVKGDNKSISIATSSIIAKIHRDRYMRFLSLKFPNYNWEQNAGYGTKRHIDEIYKNGITDYHRKSFEPIKTLIHK